MSVEKAEPLYWRSYMLDEKRLAISTRHDSEAGCFCWDVVLLDNLPNDHVSLDDLEGAGPVGRKIAAALKAGIGFTASSLGLPIGRKSGGFYPVLESDDEVCLTVIS